MWARTRARGADTRAGGVVPTDDCAGWVAADVCVGADACVGAALETWVVVLGWDCADGAGSGVGVAAGVDAGVVAGAFCGLGPAAWATVTGSTADNATTAAVRLIRARRAMTQSHARC